MLDSLEPTEVSPHEWLLLNQFLNELRRVRSSCISVYYPYGKGDQTISLINENQTNVNGAEKIKIKIQDRIDQLKKNPKSVGKFAKTLCIFGWMKNGRVVIKDVGTSKKLPYLYMTSKKPYTKPFQDILKTNRDILFVTIDQKTARIQKFHGSQILHEAKIKIDLQGRHKKGGQSQGRFLRARQTKIHVFFKRVANKVRLLDSNSELILLAGSGIAKTEFYDELNLNLSNKCRFIEGITFSTPLTILHQNIIHHLYEHRKKYVVDLVEKYEQLHKAGLTAKKNDVIHKALKKGAVDTLIVSANYHTNSQFKKILDMLEVAKSTSAKIEFAVNPKIVEKLNLHNSVLAILRYKIR